MFIIFFKLGWYIVIGLLRHGRSQRTFHLHYRSIINPSNLNELLYERWLWHCWWNHIHQSKGQFKNDFLYERRVLMKLHPPIKRCLGKCNERWVFLYQKLPKCQFWYDNEWFLFFYISIYNPPWKDINRIKF